MSAYTELTKMVGPEPGDEARGRIGTFGWRNGNALDRYVTVRRGPFGLIYVDLMGSTIAKMTSEHVQLWACGFGHAPTTRAALSFAATGQVGTGLVHSHRRRLWIGGVEFREGMIVAHDGTVIDPGEGEQVEGAPPRRRRDEAGVLR